MTRRKSSPSELPWGQRRLRITRQLELAVAWYFSNVFGHHEGPGVLPWYCTPDQAGEFAVSPSQLASGETDTLFKLFVSLSMFQARRDRVILALQRSMTGAEVRLLASARDVGRSITESGCPALRSRLFESECTVGKNSEGVDCARCPGEPCHVKEATRLLKRTGDMGKVPSSAWLRAWANGQLDETLAAVRKQPPHLRAEVLIRYFSRVHRVGRKLATMFVATLSTPQLAPGLTPWYPLVDGNQLLVIDTNVARAVDSLGNPHRSYAARTAWLKLHAKRIDLRRYRADLPAYSPRLIQQALYFFCSRSNRAHRGDACSRGEMRPCATCAPVLCPFVN